MVIPIDNAASVAQRTLYDAARPSIGVPVANLLATEIDADPTKGNRLALHPNMTELKTLFDAGKVAVVQGVGYPNQNLSHFRSEDIWFGADPVRSVRLRLVRTLPRLRLHAERPRDRRRERDPQPDLRLAERQRAGDPPAQRLRPAGRSALSRPVGEEGGARRGLRRREQPGADDRPAAHDRRLGRRAPAEDRRLRRDRRDLVVGPRRAHGQLARAAVEAGGVDDPPRRARERRPSSARASSTSVSAASTRTPSRGRSPARSRRSSSGSARPSARCTRTSSPSASRTAP